MNNYIKINWAKITKDTGINSFICLCVKLFGLYICE